MTLEDAKTYWQSQDESLPPPMSDTEILTLVKQQSKVFDKKIQRRDRRETIAAALIFLCFLPALWHASWLTGVGVALVMAGSVLTYWTLRRTRTRHAGLFTGGSLAETLRDERTKVDAQIGLLENILWWYIAPLAVGVVLVVLGESGWSAFTLGYTIFVALLSGGIYYLNQRAVRRDLQPRREELTHLLRQIDEQ